MIQQAAVTAMLKEHLSFKGLSTILGTTYQYQTPGRLSPKQATQDIESLISAITQLATPPSIFHLVVITTAEESRTLDYLHSTIDGAKRAAMKALAEFRGTACKDLPISEWRWKPYGGSLMYHDEASECTLFIAPFKVVD